MSSFYSVWKEIVGSQRLAESHLNSFLKFFSIVPDFGLGLGNRFVSSPVNALNRPHPPF